MGLRVPSFLVIVHTGPVVPCWCVVLIPCYPCPPSGPPLSFPLPSSPALCSWWAPCRDTTSQLPEGSARYVVDRSVAISPYQVPHPPPYPLPTLRLMELGARIVDGCYNAGSFLSRWLVVCAASTAVAGWPSGTMFLPMGFPGFYRGEDRCLPCNTLDGALEHIFFMTCYCVDCGPVGHVSSTGRTMALQSFNPPKPDGSWRRSTPHQWLSHRAWPTNPNTR